MGIRRLNYGAVTGIAELNRVVIADGTRKLLGKAK